MIPQSQIDISIELMLGFLRVPVVDLVYAVDEGVFIAQ